MGSAFYSLGQYEKAAEAYEKGLQFDPTNIQMKDSLEDVRKQIAPDNFGSGGFNNLFSHPNLFTKLQSDPRTKPYLNDPSFVQILNNLQKNPDSIKYVKICCIERYLCVGILLICFPAQTLFGRSENTDSFERFTGHRHDARW